MGKSKLTDSQIMEALKRVGAGVAVPEICSELGINSATFYKGRAKYGGMDTSMISHMKELELENARLKKIYAEERMKAEILTEAHVWIKPLIFSGPLSEQVAAGWPRHSMM